MYIWENHTQHSILRLERLQVQKEDRLETVFWFKKKNIHKVTFSKTSKIGEIRELWDITKHMFVFNPLGSSHKWARIILPWEQKEHIAFWVTNDSKKHWSITKKPRLTTRNPKASPVPSTTKWGYVAMRLIGDK